MDNNKIIADEAREAYRKFSKSGKTAKILFGLEKREDLKSFHDEQKQQNAYNSVNLGLKEVLIDKIIGSVQKYTDFDKNFKPKNDIIKERWEQMYVANINNTSLPPVILYKIKDEYYVYDGNHRISVAKFLGFNSIEAEVLEFLATGDKSEDIIYREKNMFDKETGLGEIMFSEPGKYNRLIQEIQKFNHFLETKKNMNVSFKEAAFRWNKEIFNPITYILNKNNIVESFDKYNINYIFLFFIYNIIREMILTEEYIWLRIKKVRNWTKPTKQQTSRRRWKMRSSKLKSSTAQVPLCAWVRTST